MATATSTTLVNVPTLGKYDDDKFDGRSHEIRQLMIISAGEQIPTSGTVYETVPDSVDTDALSQYVNATNKKWRTIREVEQPSRPW